MIDHPSLGGPERSCALVVPSRRLSSEFRCEFGHPRESGLFAKVADRLREPFSQALATAVSHDTWHVPAPFTSVQEFPGMKEEIQVAVVLKRPVQGASQHRARQVAKAQPEQGDPESR